MKLYIVHTISSVGKYIFLCLFFLGSFSATAQIRIEAISTSVQAGVEFIKVDFDQSLSALPTGFTIQTPARIALDFPSVSNGMGKSIVDAGQMNLKTVQIVQAGDRTRLVLNLKQLVNYNTQLKDKSLIISLGSVGIRSDNAKTDTVFSEGHNAEMLALKDIDFRRTSDGAGRVVVDLASNQVGVDIRRQGQTLVVDFLKTSLPQGLRRRLDVIDFGTPVQTITTVQTGDRVRMVIEPKGVWEHSAYQNDNQFVLDVRLQKQDTEKITQGQGFTGEKLSLNFQSIEVRSLLQVIADFTNFNVITSDTVSGVVTLRLKDVPWDQALDIILQSKGLGVRKNGNVLWIAPKDEIAAKEKQELEAKAVVQNLEQVRTQAFQLNYTKAAEVAAQLVATSGGAAARVLSTRGGVVAEPRTNQLFVTDIPSKLEQVQQLLAKLDIPVRQVLIEARIVYASDSFGKSLGVRLGGTDLRAQNGGDGGYAVSGNTRVAIGSNYSNAVASSGQSGTVDTTSNFVNLPAVGQGAYSAATFAVSLFSAAANRFLNLEISALEADGRGKIISSPRLVTADQVKARIEQGTELPYQMATSSGATSVAFRKATLKLEVTPQITPEGGVILTLDISNDSPDTYTASGYTIATKEIQTQVLVENGGTLVIGGIYQLDETESETKVPVLGDVPVVGNLFKTRQRSVSKKELLIFVTPKVVSDRGTTR